MNLLKYHLGLSKSIASHWQQLNHRKNSLNFILMCYKKPLKQPIKADIKDQKHSSKVRGQKS